MFTSGTDAIETSMSDTGQQVLLVHQSRNLRTHTRAPSGWRVARGLDHAIELAQNDLPLGVAHRRDEVAVGR